MRCPRCGSDQVIIQPVTETTVKGKTKGFGWIKACFGWLLFSLPGILCGLCGMGKSKNRTKTKTTYVNTCQRCGYRF